MKSILSNETSKEVWHSGENYVKYMSLSNLKNQVYYFIVEEPFSSVVLPTYLRFHLLSHSALVFAVPALVSGPDSSISNWHLANEIIDWQGCLWWCLVDLSYNVPFNSLMHLSHDHKRTNWYHSCQLFEIWFLESVSSDTCPWCSPAPTMSEAVANRAWTLDHIEDSSSISLENQLCLEISPLDILIHDFSFIFMVTIRAACSRKQDSLLKDQTHEHFLARSKTSFPWAIQVDIHIWVGVLQSELSVLNYGQGWAKTFEIVLEDVNQCLFLLLWVLHCQKKSPYICRRDEFQVKWSCATNSIGKIHRLLAFDLDWESCNDILDFQNNLKYLDIHLTAP